MIKHSRRHTSSAFGIAILLASSGQEKHGSLSTSLSECLDGMLVIRPVCVLDYCGGALGVGASVTLTFVLLLDVCVAQAHQSHLEAENPHFAVSSTDGRNRERERDIKGVQQFNSGR